MTELKVLEPKIKSIGHVAQSNTFLCCANCGKKFPAGAQVIPEDQDYDVLICDPCYNKLLEIEKSRKRETLKAQLKNGIIGNGRTR